MKSLDKLYSFMLGNMCIRYKQTVDDMEDIMTYRKGSTQYIDATLKEGENIRLYQ